MGCQTLALTTQLDAACRAADDLAAAAAEAFADHPDVEISNSFPGIGPLTGARILAEIGDDRSRFRRRPWPEGIRRLGTGHRRQWQEPCRGHRRVKNQRLAAAGYVWIFADRADVRSQQGVPRPAHGLRTARGLTSYEVRMSVDQPDGRRRTFPMDRSTGHRARPTLHRRSGRHARAYGSHRGRHHAKR